ncbi:MAG: hypothetical protein ACRD3Y_03105 [Bryobacteraceae bacterium]
MPVLPPVQSAPYDTVSTVLDAARVRLNDAIASLGGDVLTNTQPFTQTIVLLAWRRLQEFLADLGIVRLTREAILTALPPVASLDPAIQAFLNWTNYFDGVNYWKVPLLPQDLLLPLRLWERLSGQNASFAPMDNWLDGLPAWSKTASNRIWEWREDSIYLPGASQTTDLRLRYAAYLPDFVTTPETEWYEQPVPIARVLDPLAYFICSEAANARGDVDGAVFDQKAEAAARRVFNREVRMKQRVNIRRIPRSAGSRRNGFCY